jgi:Sporulation and spore germination
MFKNTIIRSLFLTCLLLVFAFSVAGCGQEPTENPKEEATINDYFPFNENVKMVYEGQGNEFASYTSYVDYINGDKIQIRVNNGGAESVNILQNSEGSLTDINSWGGDVFYKTDWTGEEATTSTILLKEPLLEGTKWDLSDGSQREITGLNVAIETPYDNFEALEVTTTKDGETVRKQYYALGIGLVKSIFFGEEEEISSSLKEMIIGGGYDFTVRSYNFFVTDTDILSNFVDKTTTLKTGENINEFLASEFQEGEIMSANTKINELWFKPGSDVANIDFSEQFVTEMNAGTTKESGVLMSVANTVGNYFQVQKVIITVEGEPYSSGHILMKEGEAFKTNYQNPVPD